MGLTNEFIQYITTPEEYDRQHYEGGSTIYGPAEGAALTDVLVEMAKRLRDGKPRAEALPVRPAPRRRAQRRAVRQGRAQRDRDRPARRRSRRARRPSSSGRAGRAARTSPLDRRFIAIQRKAKKGWKRVTDDLGVSIVWTGDPDGAYSAHWQISPKAKPGTYRFVVTANHYKLRSDPFPVDPSAPATNPDPDHPAALFAPVTAH